MPITLLILIAFIVLILDIKASLLLNRSSYYDANQKILQLALIWLVPVVGALLVWALTANTPKRRFTNALKDAAGNDDGWIRHESPVSNIGGGDAGGSD